MLGTARIALAPLLIAQGMGVRRKALKLPEARGERRGVSVDSGSGPTSRGSERSSRSPPLRLLIAGDSSAAGVGAATQSEALAGQLVRALHARGVHHVEWILEASTGWTAGDLHDHLQANPPAPFDHALVVVGVNDVTADGPPQRWIATLERIARLLGEVSPDGSTIWSGLPPMHLFPLLPQPLRWYLGERARRFDAALARWTRERSGHLHLPLVSLADTRQAESAGMVASDGFHPGPVAYRLWAEQVAEAMTKRRTTLTPP